MPDRRFVVLFCVLSLLPQLTGQGTFAGVFDSLVLWHKLTDTSGSTTAVDSSGNGYTSGTLLAGSSFSGSDLYCSGTSSGLPLASAFVTAFRQLTTYSVMLFFNPTKLTGNDRLFQVTVGTGYFYITHDGGGNKPEFYLVAGSTDTGTGGTSLSTNSWYHIALTYTGGTYVLYLNGVALRTVTGVNTPASLTGSPTSAWLGTNSGSNIFEGRLRDVRVYSRALSATEVGWAATGTNAPTTTPTRVPSTTPTRIPTTLPTQLPTLTPTQAPSTRPTQLPSQLPTQLPTQGPTQTPTRPPTLMPTTRPTLLPTGLPTTQPTISPTTLPTVFPTQMPTRGPTVLPTRLPSQAPTVSPTQLPSRAPTAVPTTLQPTITPTLAPSVRPTSKPTQAPSVAPTIPPSTPPSNRPTRVPTVLPTIPTTGRPTTVPTAMPSIVPTLVPSRPPTKIPTAAPSGIPTEPFTSSPTTRATVAPTRSPTTSRWQTLRDDTVQSCNYHTGPLLGPLVVTLALFITSVVGASCCRVNRSQVTPSLPASELRANHAKVAKRTRYLAEDRKVFWGGQISAGSCLRVPNPTRIRESSVWRDDLLYHICNHQLLLSMAFSDPLDPYGGPSGHCATFWSLAMLWFLCGVIMANSVTSTNGTMVAMYIAVAVTAAASAFNRRLYLGFFNLSYEAPTPWRRILASSALVICGLVTGSTAYSLGFRAADCKSHLPLRAFGLWGLQLATIVIIQLIGIFARILPPSQSYKVKVGRFVVLRVGQWKKQLLHEVFSSHTKLAPGPLRDKLRQYVQVNHCDSRFIGESAAFEKAITHVIVKVGPLFSIVAYDVPVALREAFEDAGPIISSDEPPVPDEDRASAEHSFASTRRLSQMNALIVQEEEEADAPRRLAAEYLPYLKEHRERRLSGSDMRVRRSDSRKSGEERRSRSRKRGDPDDDSDSGGDGTSVVRDKSRSRRSSSDDDVIQGSGRTSEEVDRESSRGKSSLIIGPTTSFPVLTSEGATRSPTPSSPVLNPIHDRDSRVSDASGRGSNDPTVATGGDGAVSVSQQRRRRRRKSSLGDFLSKPSVHPDDSEVTASDSLPARDVALPVDAPASTSAPAIRRRSSRVVPMNPGDGARHSRDRRSSLSPQPFSEPSRRRTDSNEEYGLPPSPTDVGTLILMDIEPTDEVKRSSGGRTGDDAQRRRSTDDSIRQTGGRRGVASGTADSNIDDSARPVRVRRGSRRRSTSEDDRQHPLAQGSGRRVSSMGRN